MSQEIYDKTVFKRFFELNDSKVIAWADNVFEKIKNPGILPTFIKKDGEDFESFWKTICHLFALTVLYSRKFNEIDTNRILFELFIENRGLITDEISTVEQMQYLFDNYVDEYRKRGRLDIVSKEGVILGELLRLIRQDTTREFIFALLSNKDSGWSLGYSSPLWNRTDTVLNITKGYEFTESVVDLDKYPTINKTGISIVEDLDNDGNPIRSMTFIGDELTGLSAEDNKLNVLKINENLDYQISFKIKYSDAIDQNVKFGVEVYDEIMNPLDCFEAYRANPTLSDTVSNSFITNDGNLMLPVANVFYECRGILFKRNTVLSQQADLNFLNGRALKLPEGARYISIKLIQDRTVLADGAPNPKTISGVYIYDIKIKPLYLPFYQGYLGDKNVIASYYENNSLRSINTIEQFIETYLISYKNIFAGKEIKENVKQRILFKVVSNRREYLNNATLSINGETLITNENGEVESYLFPGNYLYSVERESFTSIENAELTITQSETDEIQIVYITMDGSVQEKTITFNIRDSYNNPIEGAIVTFNNNFLVTKSDGIATFKAFASTTPYPYSVKCNGYYIKEDSVLVTSEGVSQTVDVTLTSKPRYSMTFVVENNEGEKVKEAFVTVTSADEVYSISGNTNQEGKVIFDNIPEGNYYWTVEKKDWLLSSSEEPVFLNENKTFDVRLEPIPTHTITFVVYDRNLTTKEEIPLKGALVSFGGSTKQSDDNGEVSFIVKQATYNYSVSYNQNDNYNPSVGVIDVDQDKTESLYLDRKSYDIEIKVVNLDGVIIPNALVKITNKDNPDEIYLQNKTDEKGIVVFNLCNGSYNSRTIFEEYYIRDIPFAINKENTQFIVNIQVRTSLVIFKVSDIEDNLVSNAIISINNQTKNTLSNGEARFELPKGDYPYFVSKNDYDNINGVLSIKNTEVQNIIREDLTLLKGKKEVTLKVVDDNNNGLSNLPLTIKRVVNDTVVYVGVTDYKGEVKIPLYIDIEYEVIVQSNLGDVRFRLVVVNSDNPSDNLFTILVSEKRYSISMTLLTDRSFNVNPNKVGLITLNGESISIKSNKIVISNQRSGVYTLKIEDSDYYYGYEKEITIDRSNIYLNNVILRYKTVSDNFSLLLDNDYWREKEISLKITDADDNVYDKKNYTTIDGIVPCEGPFGGKVYLSVIDNKTIDFEDLFVGVLSEELKAIYSYSSLILEFFDTNFNPIIIDENNVSQTKGSKLYIQSKSLGERIDDLSVETIKISCNNNKDLESIRQWPKAMSIEGVGLFEGCSNLLSIDETVIPIVEGDVDRWFMNCSSLKEISAGLFTKMTGTSCVSCFEGSGIEIIPDGPLFSENAIYHERVFANCVYLKKIGSKIFGIGGSEHDFDNAFLNAGSRTKELITTGGDDSVETSPFYRSTNANSLFGAFSNSSIQRIGLHLLDNCTKIKSFAYTFSYCKNLKEYSFNTFNNCTIIESFEATFIDCILLPNPDKGLDVNTNLKKVNSMLEGCLSVTEVGSLGSMFDYVTDATRLFARSGIRSLPQNFFVNSTITIYKEFCKDCYNLTTLFEGSVDSIKINAVPQTNEYRTLINTKTFSSRLGQLNEIIDLTGAFENCQNLEYNSQKICTLFESTLYSIGGLILDKTFRNCKKVLLVPVCYTSKNESELNYIKLTDSVACTDGYGVISHRNTFEGSGVKDVPENWK